MHSHLSSFSTASLKPKRSCPAPPKGLTPENAQLHQNMQKQYESLEPLKLNAKRQRTDEALEILKFEAQLYSKNKINPEIIRSRVEQQLTGGFDQSDQIGGSGMKNVEKMLRGG
jgi:hypothetical protein